MTQWLSLITSLPTENATARMRAWRALKASGAAVLRDGVYLMPEREACRNTLDAVATDILGAGGTVFVLRVEEPDGAAFVSLFDRREDYAVLLADISKAHAGLAAETAADTLKQARKLRKTFAGLAEIDFFPGEARRQAEAALQDLEQQAGWALSPDEPHAVAGTIPQLPLGLYLGRTWATRRRPWVDRLASAWLIRRFIDPQAHLLWLDDPAERTPPPAGALGYDYDGAEFTHVGPLVTFEVLAIRFGLEADPALQRIARAVHLLDVGGIPMPEAPGLEAVLAGLRVVHTDDDSLVMAAAAVFDALHAAPGALA